MTITIGRAQAEERRGKEEQKAHDFSRAVSEHQERSGRTVRAEAGPASDRSHRRRTYLVPYSEQLSQEDLINYLLSKLFDQGVISNMEESEQMKKLLNAVIKKFIREERMLMIVEDSNELSKKILQKHPNYVQQ